MSLESIIRYCAPTLAGLKVGSLFSHRYSCEKQLREQVAQRNRHLNAKGIYFYLLRCEHGFSLIYVYRKKQLEAVLQEEEVQTFLSEWGYDRFNLSATLSKLKERTTDKDFPHEIGVFLGYPMGDIKAFIQHKGANSICEGCWKVYTDEQSAKQTFARYKRCTNSYVRQYSAGIDLDCLTVVV